jgi:L-alanine-DL-glutamate epimerase-like enolase superfamily enzyme
MRLSLAPYRLLFREPFGTAHGLRDGTDSVFVRLEDEGVVGYGEATLPPYVKETPDLVVHSLREPELLRSLEDLTAISPVLPEWFDRVGSTAGRTALSTAYYDLVFKRLNIPASSHFKGSVHPQAMVTLGHGETATYAARIARLPAGFGVLKIKLGTPHDLAIIQAVRAADDRPLLLDANQGWTRPEQALKALAMAGPGRVVGIEQPFHADDTTNHLKLSRLTEVPVIADESVQDVADLERHGDAFGGVNIKLMKCGGLDRALELATRARALGKVVMLGSMSESSLGCAAMFSLAGHAELLDLDGPWLLKNDPFTGLTVRDGSMAVEGPTGFGVTMASDVQLPWS